MVPWIHMANLSLLTLNLAVEYPWEEKKDLLIETLRQLDPDFICFQEIFNSEKVKQGKALGDILNYSFSQILTMPYSANNISGTFGSAIFSKQKHYSKEIFKVLLNKKSQKLVEDKLQRAFIVSNYQIGKKTFWLVNVHLSTNFEYRKSNWNELENWLDKNVPKNASLIICGDFNTCGEENNMLNSEVVDIQDEVISGGFKNAWDLVNSDPCITYRSSDWWLKNYANSIEALKIREKNRSYTAKVLDYFFVNDFVEVKSVETIDLVHKVSDHLGLFMRFEL